MNVSPNDVAASLAQHGIFLRRNQPGEHRARCPQCDRDKRDDALAVRVDDRGATWVCHRCAWKGGVIDTIDRVAGMTRRREPRPPEPARHETLAPWGRELWRSYRPITAGSIAATYLERRRCIVPPGDLRWQPNLLDRASGYCGPALVALVTNVETGEPISLHHTWLAPDGSGKAPIDKPRRLLKGHRLNGVIRLWPDEDVTLGLVVGEGVETCLAAASAGLKPAWATISAGNLAAFPVLPGVEGLTILADHDPPHPKTGNRVGVDAALAVLKRYTEAGFDPARDIRVILPPNEGQDAADLGANQ